MKIDAKAHDKLKRLLAVMKEEREPWLNYWQLIANYILPRRFVGLSIEGRPGQASELRNPFILDGTATIAAHTLAAGMMNGITSPARPWFRLRASDVFEDNDARIWLDDATQRMLFIMAETNFYNAMATVYADLVGFGTAAMLIYEDDDSIFRCYNSPLGEFAVLQNNRKLIDRFARTFRWRAEQIVNEFGIENVSERVKASFEAGGGRMGDKYDIAHLIEPNDDGPLKMPPVFRYREIYWEIGGGTAAASGGVQVGGHGVLPGDVLRLNGFRDWPAVAPRWDTLGNDSYGSGPAADALGDIMQLQHMTKRKAQALDKMVSPPMVADIQLQHRPTALLPNGVTYVAGAQNAGFKPAYTVQPPIRELAEDILQIQIRIREFFHNDLFRMISELDAVRTATEIDARREEKLVLLGPVLERFENEALDPALRRVFSIMLRRGMFLPLPESLEETDLEIEYVSVLNDAQRAIGAAPIERYVAFLGNIAGVRPEVLEIPNWTELTLDYSERLGVPAKNNKTRDEVAALLEQQAEAQQMENAAAIAPPMADAAKNLSATDVGGGANALQMLLGR